MGIFRPTIAGTAGNDPGALRCRLHVDLGRGVAGDHCILQGAALGCHRDHVLARIRHRLLDGSGYFAGLPPTETHAAFAVTDHRQGREAELTPAFDDLGDTIDGDQLLDEFVATDWTLKISHGSTLETPSLKTSSRVRTRSRRAP